MSLIWPQKMYAMARHLQLVKRKLPGVTRHEPSHFAIEPTEAVASKEYGDLNRQLAFEAAELRDRIGGGEYPIRHHKNLAIVKTGKVEKISGFTFTEASSGWQCKLPDRAVFHKWGKGETLKANRTTQKFVALMLAKHGLAFENFETFPFDRIVMAESAEELAELLNELLVAT